MSRSSRRNSTTQHKSQFTRKQGGKHSSGCTMATGYRDTSIRKRVRPLPTGRWISSSLSTSLLLQLSLHTSTLLLHGRVRFAWKSPLPRAIADDSPSWRLSWSSVTELGELRAWFEELGTTMHLHMFQLKSLRNADPLRTSVIDKEQPVRGINERCDARPKSPATIKAQAR